MPELKWAANGHTQVEEYPAFITVKVTRRQKRAYRHLAIELDSFMCNLGGDLVRARLAQEPELEQMMALFDVIRERAGLTASARPEISKKPNAS